MGRAGVPRADKDEVESCRNYISSAQSRTGGSLIGPVRTFPHLPAQEGDGLGQKTSLELALRVHIFRVPLMAVLELLWQEGNSLAE